MVNRTVVGGNQIPMLRHTLQKRKKKRKKKQYPIPFACMGDKQLRGKTWPVENKPTQ